MLKNLCFPYTRRLSMKYSSLVMLMIMASIKIKTFDEPTNHKTLNFLDLGDDDYNLIQNDSFEALFDKANNALRTKNYDKAIAYYQAAIKKNSRAPQPYFNMAIAYQEKKEIDKAIEAFKDAILQNLNYVKAHIELAKILQSRELLDEAIVHYRKAVDIDPSLVEIALTVARLLNQKEQFSESLPYFKIAAEGKADDVMVSFEYANVLNTCNYTQQALDIYLKLLEKRPNDSGILYNTAYTLKKLNRIKEAMPYYTAALKRNPNHAEAHFSLGLAHLITGNFAQGWPEYEWRWQRNTQLEPREFSQPQWDGVSSLQGKTILLHAEQGLGDTFQFIRYAQIIKEKYHPKKLIVAVQKPLLTIITQCCPYIDSVVTLSAMPTTFDLHVPLMTLPLLLKSDEQTIPRTIPYIFPDVTLVEMWRRKLSSDTNFKIGICWQGNSNYSTAFLRTVVAAKSMQLQKFNALGGIPNVSFYSLQKQTGTDQLQVSTLNFDLKVFETDFDESRGRFMDTAAVIKNLDLVITIDTSISHLAAAIGTPVWIMIPEPPDWRWMIERADTPWYPNMRLFRQPTVGDWDSVLALIRQELSDVIQAKKPVLRRTATTPATNTQLEQPTLRSLKQEYDNITKKLQSLTLKMKNIDHSPDNSEFIKTMRECSTLIELRNAILEKITLLEDIAS